MKPARINKRKILKAIDESINQLLRLKKNSHNGEESLRFDIDTQIAHLADAHNQIIIKGTIPFGLILN